MIFKKLIWLIVIIIFWVFSCLTMPMSIAGNIKDFQISAEPEPSLFIQKAPRLYTDLNNGFMVVWEDSRLGELCYFAQRFDSSGLPLDNNFQVIGNAGMAFLPDGTGMIIGAGIESGTSFNEFSSYVVYGQLLTSHGILTQTFFVDNGTYPDCGTGFWGVDVKLIAGKENFLFGFNFGGHLNLKKFDIQGNVIFNSDDNIELPETAAKFSLAANFSDHYTVLWFNANPDVLPSGIYASFFNSENSIISENILVQEYTAGYRYQEQAPRLRAIAVSDSAYAFFWADADSMDLKYAVYDTSGRAVTPVISIRFPFLLSGYGQEIYNFAFSNIKRGTYAALITVSEYEQIPTLLDPLYYSSILYRFNDNNELLNISSEDFSEISFIGENLAQTKPGILVSALEINNDIFIVSRNDSTWLDSLQVNDDQLGSNQVCPQAVVKDVNSYFISWRNEKNYYGRIIDLDGNMLSDEILLKGQKMLFLNDSSAVNFWEREEYDGEIEYGMTIYNTHTWNIMKSEPIGWNWYRSGSVDYIPTSANSFAILMNKNDGLWLISYSSIGEKIIEKNVQNRIGFNIAVIANDINSFWVLWDGKVQLYSVQLQPLSSVFELGLSPMPILHVGAGRFLKISSFTDPLRQFATVVDTTGAQLFHFPIITDYPMTNISLTQIDSTKFIALWTYNHEIYARTFTIAGELVTDNVIIHADIDAYRNWANACVNGDNILFTWADARNKKHGYDIYGSIHEIADVTPVNESEHLVKFPADYELMQNYSNPFNSTTKIDYTLPEGKTGFQVSIKIYDIRGRLVNVLVNQNQVAGTHSVNWDGKDRTGNRVSSGIYFYSLQVADFKVTKKMLLLE